MRRRPPAVQGTLALLALSLAAAPASAGERVPVHAIPPDAHGQSGPHGLRVIPRRSPNPAALEAVKRARARRNGAAYRDTPSAAVIGSLNQPGLSAQDATPPDTTGSIGPNFYVEAVNHQIGVFSRASLGLVSYASLEDFAGNGVFNCDPQIQWDAQASRWAYVMIDCDPMGQETILFGWSRTSDPRPLNGTGWCRFSMTTGTTADDYPKLGHNNTHWVVTSNRFTGPFFLGVGAYTIQKPASGVTTCAAQP